MPDSASKPNIRDVADTDSDHEYLVVGPYCWGRATNAHTALVNAKKKFPRHVFRVGVKINFHLIRATKGCGITDMGGFRIPSGGSITWVAAYGPTGVRRDDVTNPYSD